jgi:hypothetical protein
MVAPGWGMAGRWKHARNWSVTRVIEKRAYFFLHGIYAGETLNRDFLDEEARYPDEVWCVGKVSTRAFDCTVAALDTVCRC